MAWSDGREDYIPLVALRRFCPCAACRGEPDVMGNPGGAVLDPAKARADLRSWQIVGGYGFQPRWGDGHATGIYTYAALRELGEGATP